MDKCSECMHAVFDPLWGEYKCKVLKTVAPGPSGVIACKDYKKGKPEKTKAMSKEDN